MEVNQNKKCEICGIEATNLCFSCISYYCDNCFKFIHDKEINNQHKKEKIDIMYHLIQNVPNNLKFQ